MVRGSDGWPAPRQKGLETLRRAFRNESFLRAAWATALATLGPEAAVGALPGEVPTLRQAEQLARDAGDRAATDLIAARLKAVSDLPPASRPSP